MEAGEEDMSKFSRGVASVTKRDSVTSRDANCLIFWVIPSDLGVGNGGWMLKSEMLTSGTVGGAEIDT